MSVHGLNTEDLERRIAARISSLATSALDAFVICSSTTAEAGKDLAISISSFPASQRTRYSVQTVPHSFWMKAVYTMAPGLDSQALPGSND